MARYEIRATYMRGGTSKGVFFHTADLPLDPEERDRVLLRVIGSPDPYRRQLDGMGAATSSTSKVILVAPTARPDCELEYRFGQVAIDAPLVDWSGNCGNLTAAVAPFAIARGIVDAPADGFAEIRMWQADIGRVIRARVPMGDGEVVEEGPVLLDGIPFPAAEIRLDFLDPGGESAAELFPTGNACDTLDVPSVGPVRVTLINAGNPTVIVHASTLGLAGTEAHAAFTGNAALLERCEAIRACGSVAMGCARTMDEATHRRPATPKIAFVSAPAPYLATDGTTRIEPPQIDIVARIVSMGQLHHALTGTGSVALAVAAAVPGTIPHEHASGAAAEGAERNVRIGHPAGIISLGVVVQRSGAEWHVADVIATRTARVLMDGVVRVPRDVSAPALAGAGRRP